MIAALRPEETEAAIALWRETGLTRPWNDPRADIALALRNESSTVLVMREDNALVATGMVGIDGHRGYVYYLAVSPAHRKRGLGRAMMQACEEWIVARGHPKMHLFVRSENRAVVDFYKALGYRVEDTLLLGKRFDGRQAP